MDETGLYNRMSSNRTIVKRQIAGSKNEKTRLSVALTANSMVQIDKNNFLLRHAAKPGSFRKNTA